LFTQTGEPAMRPVTVKVCSAQVAAATDTGASDWRVEQSGAAGAMRAVRMPYTSEAVGV
jgi:hypothetical protein